MLFVSGAGNALLPFVVGWPRLRQFKFECVAGTDDVKARRKQGFRRTGTIKLKLLKTVGTAGGLF